MKNITNHVWQEKVGNCLANPQFVASPRGMEVREILAGQYTVPMPAYINLVDRRVNVNFMFAEAAWIISGNNMLWPITEHMKGYAKFSDDGVFMRGAYGPKVVDQLGYVVDSLEKDLDTRQAVINVWRERPGPSKDIPCTLSMQFVARDGRLHAIVTMRSHDVVLGFTYDVFTFSMVAKSVQLLLAERGIYVELGDLTVTAGSLHLYSDYYEKAENWLGSEEEDERIVRAVDRFVNNPKIDSYDKLRVSLEMAADEYGKSI